MKSKIIESSNLQTIFKKALSDTGAYQKDGSMELISQNVAAISNESEDKESPIIKRKIKKSDITNILSTKKSKINLPIGKLYTMSKTNEEKEVFKTTKKDIMEKWSQEYKKSIDCDNPKGFSQKAHCDGKKKKSENKEATGAGSAGGFVAPFAFKQDTKFVKDSFKETPKKVETKEATGSGSAGSYESPAAWAKSTSKKDWRGKSKTLFPGGQFVQVKKKCKTFPYCNQGDINALKLTNEENLKKTITKLSEKHNISEELIRKIIQIELGIKK